MKKGFTLGCLMSGLFARTLLSGDSGVTSTNDALATRAGPAAWGGIGAAVTSLQGKLHITSVFRDTPACRAGLKPRDVITEIDSTSPNGLAMEDLPLAMRGEVGSVLHLTILREGESQPLRVEIKREVIRFGGEQPCE